ncbi:hypothetical protein PIB30_096841 [Stylosanthes scabra]|uniref:Multiple C2 domain-containing protein n=1 Tax=Stylosanthes scabra TaxID=79078 RepID=A0ABU6ZV76_9FABA|nr:hypothetical protein [Stylosanthes scabra]
MKDKFPRVGSINRSRKAGDNEEASTRFVPRIHLRFLLEEVSMNNGDETVQGPADSTLWKPHIGVLELQILSATGLLPVQRRETGEERDLMHFVLQSMGKNGAELALVVKNNIHRGYSGSFIGKYGLCEPQDHDEHGQQVDYPGYDIIGTEDEKRRTTIGLEGGRRHASERNSRLAEASPFSIIPSRFAHTPRLIIPTIFLYIAVVGFVNYRYRPRHPPRVDAGLSHADSIYPDELDEEFDEFPTARPNHIVAMRYDRLRYIAKKLHCGWRSGITTKHW